LGPPQRGCWPGFRILSKILPQIFFGCINDDAVHGIAVQVNDGCNFESAYFKIHRAVVAKKHFHFSSERRMRGDLSRSYRKYDRSAAFTIFIGFVVVGTVVFQFFKFRFLFCIFSGVMQ